MQVPSATSASRWPTASPATSLTCGAGCRERDVHRGLRRAVCCRRCSPGTCRRPAVSACCRGPRNGWSSSGCRPCCAASARPRACTAAPSNPPVDVHAQGRGGVHQHRLHPSAQRRDEDDVGRGRRGRCGCHRRAGEHGTTGRRFCRTCGRTVEPILSLWRRLGLAAEQLREVAVSPTCGLAGVSPQAALAAMRRCREAGSRLAEGEL